MGWLVEGLVLVGGTGLARTTLRRWRATRRKVMMYPGAAAVGAYVALESLPLCALLVALAALAASAGLALVAGLLATVAAVVGLAAMCAIGVLVPNLGVERTRVHASR